MTSESAVVSYRLVALDVGVSDRSQAGAPWRDLGSFIDLDAALRARIEDVVAQLTANEGRWIQVEHLLIGPGPDGAGSVHSCVSSVGADPESVALPQQFEPDTVRSWLLAAHGLPSAPTTPAENPIPGSAGSADAHGR